jgi:hypothetical protein
VSESDDWRKKLVHSDRSAALFHLSLSFSRPASVFAPFVVIFSSSKSAAHVFVCKRAEMNKTNKNEDHLPERSEASVIRVSAWRFNNRPTCSRGSTEPFSRKPVLGAHSLDLCTRAEHSNLLCAYVADDRATHTNTTVHSLPGDKKAKLQPKKSGIRKP